MPQFNYNEPLGKAVEDISYGRAAQSPVQAAMTPQPRYNEMKPPKSDALWNTGTAIKGVLPGFGNSFRSLGAGIELEPHNYASSALEGLIFTPFGASTKPAQAIAANRMAGATQNSLRALKPLPKAAQARYEAMRKEQLTNPILKTQNAAENYRFLADDVFNNWSKHNRYVKASRGAENRLAQLKNYRDYRYGWDPIANKTIDRPVSFEEASQNLDKLIQGVGRSNEDLNRTFAMEDSIARGTKTSKRSAGLEGLQQVMFGQIKVEPSDVLKFVNQLADTQNNYSEMGR